MAKAWTTRIRPRLHVRTAATAALALGLVSGTSGCRWLTTGAPEPLQPTPVNSVQRIATCASACRDSVDVVAMGVSGFLVLPWRDTTRLVLTPPMLTNPTVWWMTFGDPLFGTSADTARITRRLAAMPAANAERLSRVHAVLVGHGHYDHLMDLPPLLPRMPHAVVYGSSTVANLLAPVPGLVPARRVAVDSIAGTGAAFTGRSIDVGPAVRVHAMRWAHAPNFASLTIAPGHQTTPRRSLPRTIHGWKMGQPFAWAIDVRDTTGTVQYRFVYHDAAAGGDVQRRAAEVIRALPTATHTVLMMTAANYDQPGDYPDVLLASLAPEHELRHVLLGHWDDFFTTPERPARVVRGIDARALAAHLNPFVGDRWSAPRAGAVTRFVW